MSRLSLGDVRDVVSTQRRILYEHKRRHNRDTSIEILTVTSSIVINVPTRSLLAVETKNSFVLWLANLNIKRIVYKQ